MKPLDRLNFFKWVSIIIVIQSILGIYFPNYVGVALSILGAFIVAALGMFFFMGYIVTHSLFTLGIKHIVKAMRDTGMSIFSVEDIVEDIGVFFQRMPFEEIIIVVLEIFLVAMFVHLSIRRCKDLNKSGWNTLIYMLPFINILYFISLLVKPSYKEQEKSNEV